VRFLTILEGPVVEITGPQEYPALQGPDDFEEDWFGRPTARVIA